MKSYAIYLFSACALLFFISCQPNPDEVLAKAREKLKSSSHVSFQSTYYWPDMIGQIDTTFTHVQLLNDDSDILGYSFAVKTERYDALYRDGDYQVFNHENKNVRFVGSESITKNPDQIHSTIYVKYGPEKALRFDNWEYLGDTSINRIRLLRYHALVSDTVHNGMAIRVERNLYVDPSHLVVYQSERLAFQDDKLAQKVIFRFEEYEFSDKAELDYTLPEGYVTGANTSFTKRLEVGDKAPDFIGISMDGDTISLAGMKGTKVLIDFSIINCGFCKQAIKHINKSPERFNQNIKAIYINPRDSTERMRKYDEMVSIPFPVIAGRKDIGEDYGVNGYPYFYLVDEEGIIEEIQYGYHSGFIDRFL